MKSLILALSIAVLGATLLPTDADARRLGGGASTGMQRSVPSTRPAAPVATSPASPTQAAPTAPATAAAPAAAAAPKRSWMGPLAGLAAGLGLAALMSHLGMGAEFGSLITMLLVGMIAVVAIRFLMRRFAGNGAGMATPNGMAFNQAPQNASWTAPAANASGKANANSPSLSNTLASTSGASTLPADFDAAGFERIAKMIFIRMQAANDAADLNDLRTFTTPEMFAAVRLDLQERGSTAQQTDVVRVDAQVLDVASEAQRQIVSVRFHGLIREELNGPVNPFDEVWHLVRPTDGSQGWAIAGIQQAVAA